jgi:hypothetical protein
MSKLELLLASISLFTFIEGFIGEAPGPFFLP